MVLPMFERHTGQYMLELLAKLLSIMDNNWKAKLIGATSDGAARRSQSFEESNID